jgi:hypothetical protein
MPGRANWNADFSRRGTVPPDSQRETAHTG